MTDGQPHYAIIDGDRIISRGLFERGLPGSDDLTGSRRLVPVEFVDSQPFDAAIHYRLAPKEARIDGERVVVTYPVVLKSEDGAV